MTGRGAAATGRAAVSILAQMPRRRLLVITYYYPPNPSIGGHRWAAMTRYLREAGHDVTVLTTTMNGTLPDDGEQQVVRAWDLQASDGIRRLVGRAPMETAATGKGGAPTTAAPAPRWMTHGLVPDSGIVAWVPAAVREARRIVRERSIDCVITSAPPDSVAMVPLFLGRHRPAWVADFRDGWTFEPLRGAWPTRPQARLDARLERKVTGTADVVIGATEPIARDFTERLGANGAYVPNAWDPALDAAFDAAQPVPLDPERFNLVYTGQLSGPAGRDPRPLLEAMNRLVELRGDAARRLRLVLVGGLDQHDARLLDELDGHGLVEPVGQQPRDVSIATQRAGDALLLLTTPGHASHATGKLFEYLAAERPILALASGSAAAQIISDTKTGISVPPDDVPAITEALGRMLDGQGAAHAPDRDELARYRYPGPAEHVERLVEQAIERRSTRR